jgi:hypothetical protein
MPMLEIGDKRVEVGEEFLKLSPDEQQRTVNDIARQIGIAATPAQRGEPVAVTGGEKQFEADKKLLEKQAGLAPDALKAFTYSALNTALLNAPSHVVALWDKISTGKDYTKAFEEQKSYEKALERQHPYASGAGTAAGIGAGFLVPGGAPAQAAKAAATAKYGATAGRLAEIGAAGGVGAGVSGLSAALEKPVTKPGEMFSRETFNQAMIGAGIGAGAQALLPKLFTALSRKPKIVDEAGNLTEEAKNAFKSVYGDRYDAAEIERMKDALASSMSKKGPTEAAVKEAMLKSEEIPTVTRSMTTGEKPLPAAAEVAEYAQQQARQKLGEKARGLMGERPGETEVAESLYKGALGAQKEVSGAYEGMRKLTGQVTPEAEKAFTGANGALATAIHDALLAQNLPTTFGKGEGFKKARQAMQWMEKNPISGNYIHDEGLTVRNIEAINQQLNRYYRSARGKPDDQMAISVMKDAFNDSIRKIVKNPDMFEGDGKAVVDAIDKARASFASMKDIYAPSTSTGAGASEFNRVMDEFAKTASGRVRENLQQGSLNAAQKTIDTYLTDPKVGLAFYDRLQKALGKDSEGMKAVNQKIKIKLLDTGDDLHKLPERINEFLQNNRELAGKVFDTDQRYQLKKLADSLDIIYRSGKPNEQQQSLAMNAIKKTGNLLAGVAVGQVKGPIAGAAVYGGAEAVRAASRGLTRARQRIVEEGGAPAFKRTPETGSRYVPTPSSEPFRSKEEEPSYGPPQPLPPLTIRRATGGRVGGIAAKLMSDVERARKEVSGKTKALLNADDTHIARALEVANRGLEG